MSRVCGKCGVVLSKDNTGELKWLQPYCNSCTKKNNTCNHMMKKTKTFYGCILCGFLPMAEDLK